MEAKMKMNVLIFVIGSIPVGLFGLKLTLGSDIFYTRDITGKVVAQSKRIVTEQRSTYEKVAIRLKPFDADATVTKDVAGEEGLDIECISTKCTLLNEGECVMFACKRDVRFFEPNVVECKAIKTIMCKE